MSSHCCFILEVNVKITKFIEGCFCVSDGVLDFPIDFGHPVVEGAIRSFYFAELGGCLIGTVSRLLETALRNRGVLEVLLALKHSLIHANNGTSVGAVALLAFKLYNFYNFI